MDERSLERIEKSDLLRLGEIARRDFEELFRRHPETGRFYHNQLFAIALCQGAALHYIDGRNGVKDFDVWSFFRENPQRPFPYRRVGRNDFGSPKFGKTPEWDDSYIGRRVDTIGRSLPFSTTDTAADVLRQYLARASSPSPRELAKKAVVLIYPEDQLGVVVWPQRNGN